MGAQLRPSEPAAPRAKALVRPPPAPASEPGTIDRPALVKAGFAPVRGESRDTVEAWRARRRVSDRDVRVILGGASQNRIDEMSAGRAPFPLDLIFALPDRDARDLLRAIEDALDARRARSV